MQNYYVEANAMHGIYKADGPGHAIHLMLVDAGYNGVFDAILQSSMTVDQFMNQFTARLATQEEKEVLA